MSSRARKKNYINVSMHHTQISAKTLMICKFDLASRISFSSISNRFPLLKSYDFLFRLKLTSFSPKNQFRLRKCFKRQSPQTFVINTPLRVVFLTLFSVFENVFKNGLLRNSERAACSYRVIYARGRLLSTKEA